MGVGITKRSKLSEFLFKRLKTLFEKNSAMPDEGEEDS